MAFSINGNAAATQAYNSLLATTTKTQKSQEELASGNSVSNPADNTSAYRVSSELNTQINLMQSAQTNVSEAQNLLSTGQSALSSVNDLLTQIKGTISSATDPTADLSSLANDINSLGNEISAIFSNTNFNSTALLSGATLPRSGNFVFQTGPTETTTINFGNLATLNLASISGTGATAGNITSIDVTSLQTAVQNALGSIGDYEQRMSVKSDYLTSAISNAQSTVASLTGANVAQDQMKSTQGQIAEQISTTMLSQLNSAPNQLLRLFQ
jgi:flagellin